MHPVPDHITLSVSTANPCTQSLTTLLCQCPQPIHAPNPWPHYSVSVHRQYMHPVPDHIRSVSTANPCTRFRCHNSSSNSCFISLLFCCLFSVPVCLCQAPLPTVAQSIKPLACLCETVFVVWTCWKSHIAHVSDTNCISVLREPRDNGDMTVPHPLLLDAPTSASFQCTCLACYLLRSNFETLRNDGYIQCHCVRTACSIVHIWKCCCSCELVFVLAQWIQGMFKKRPNFCYRDVIAHFTAF
jgi:hypothetical protein